MLKHLTTAAAALVLGTSLAGASDLRSMSWDEIVAQAQEEGELTWYVWYLRDDLRRFVQAFEHEYGITVTIPEGTEDTNRDKLLAERNREEGDIDVFAYGFNNFETLDLPSLFMELDMLPQDDGRIRPETGGDYILGFWGNQTGIAYDPARVDDADLPQSPEDLVAFWSEHPGKFGFNYENGGSGPSFFLSTLRAVADLDYSASVIDEETMQAVHGGYDFFNAHADNYIITASNADNIIRISDGELWMAPAWEDHLSGLQKRGEVREDIAFYIPEMGMFGGGNGVAIPGNARHAAAAAVFIDWLTSPETQTALNQQFGTAPMNARADDSFALVPAAQRAHSREWVLQPLRNEIENGFIDHVILER